MTNPYEEAGRCHKVLITVAALLIYRVTRSEAGRMNRDAVARAVGVRPFSDESWADVLEHLPDHYPPAGRMGRTRRAGANVAAAYERGYTAGWLAAVNGRHREGARS